MKKITVNLMVTTALLISISVVLARFCVVYITPSVRINFGNVPIMLSGLMYGPIVGAIAGTIADIIGSVLLSAFGWYPPLTVSAAIMGLVPGLLAFLYKNGRSLKKTLIIVFASNLAGTMLWSTFWLARLSNVSFWSLAVVRIPLYIGMTVLESILLFALYKAVVRIKKEPGDTDDLQ